MTPMYVCAHTPILPISRRRASGNYTLIGLNENPQLLEEYLRAPNRKGYIDGVWMHKRIPEMDQDALLELMGRSRTRMKQVGLTTDDEDARFSPYVLHD